jgi:hypothetical protein
MVDKFIYWLCCELLSRHVSRVSLVVIVLLTTLIDIVSFFDKKYVQKRDNLEKNLFPYSNPGRSMETRTFAGRSTEKMYFLFAILPRNSLPYKMEKNNSELITKIAASKDYYVTQ